MGYIGTKPSAVPLTSADITDGIITSAKIADGTIVNADINASAGIVTSKLSGALGITEADQWRLSADIAAAGDADITTNLERNDNNSFEKIGTGMTQSSGIFTFPTTGIYYVQAVYECMAENASRYISCIISTTINNSTYTNASKNNSHIAIAEAGQNYTTIVSSTIIDVTNTTNVKCKFRQEWNTTTSNTIRASTTQNITHFTFIRLGDT